MNCSRPCPRRAPCQLRSWPCFAPRCSIRRDEQQAAKDLLERSPLTAPTHRSGPPWSPSNSGLADPEAARETLGRVPESVRDAPSLLLDRGPGVARSTPDEARGLLDGIEKRAGSLDAERRGASAGRHRHRCGWPSGIAKGPSGSGRQPRKSSPKISRFVKPCSRWPSPPKTWRRPAAIVATIAEIAGRGFGPGPGGGGQPQDSRGPTGNRQKQEESDGRCKELPENVRALLDEARNYLIEAENERPGWSQVQILFAEVENLRGNVAGAIDRLRRAVTAGASNPAVIRRLVALLYSANRLEEAQEAMGMLGEDGVAGLERISAEVELRAGKSRRGGGARRTERRRRHTKPRGPALARPVAGPLGQERAGRPRCSSGPRELAR